MSEIGPSIAEISPPIAKPEIKAPEATPKAESPAKEGAKDLLAGIESFTTAKGSVYTYDSEGRTSRFKTATGEQYPPQDITVFADLDPDENQEFLRAIHQPSESDQGKRVYVIELDEHKTPKIIKSLDQVKNPDNLYLSIVRDGKPLMVKHASILPEEGATVFDTRLYKTNDGETRRERHLGNKVVDVKKSKPKTSRDTEIKSTNKDIDASIATEKDAATRDIKTDSETEKAASFEDKKIEEKDTGDDEKRSKLKNARDRADRAIKRGSELNSPMAGIRDIAQRLESQEEAMERTQKALTKVFGEDALTRDADYFFILHPGLDPNDPKTKANATNYAINEMAKNTVELIQTSSTRDLNRYKKMLDETDYPHMFNNLKHQLLENITEEKKKRKKNAISILVGSMIALASQGLKESTEESER